MYKDPGLVNERCARLVELLTYESGGVGKFGRVRFAENGLRVVLGGVAVRLAQHVVQSAIRGRVERHLVLE